MMQGQQIYQFHVWLRGISPMVWGRLLLRSDQTIAVLHDAIQIAFGWSDSHLNRFRIHGRDFGVYHSGGPAFNDDPHQIVLGNFDFRIGERFLYEYDFGDNWLHEIRLEHIDPPTPIARTYPVCIAGKRSAPPEDCGGVEAFQHRRDEAPWQAEKLLDQMLECAENRDIAAVRDLAKKIPLLQTWLTLDKFDRRQVNRCLRLYSAGDPRRSRGAE